MGAGRDKPYHIPNRATTIATYWLLQWVGIAILGAVIAALLDGWSVGVLDVLSWLAAATVWSVIIMLLQAAYAFAPSTVGGRNEIGRVRSEVSVISAALGATGLFSLVMWMVIAGVASAMSSTKAIIPLLITGVVGMIAAFVVSTVLIRTFLRRGRREERSADLSRRLLGGTGLCAMVCAGFGVIATLIAGDGGAFFAVMVFSAPWLIGATIALTGCRLYLKRLWKFRAPWYETHCAECGYDMAGNLAVTQCSECGTPWKHEEILIAGSRRAACRCETCNHDMSAIPDADRCPECGSGWRSERERGAGPIEGDA